MSHYRERTGTGEHSECSGEGERSPFVKGSHASLRIMEEEEMGAERTGNGKRKEKKYMKRQ